MDRTTWSAWLQTNGPLFDAARNLSPDIVILDSFHSAVEGIDAATEAKKLCRHSTLICVTMQAHAYRMRMLPRIEADSQHDVACIAMSLPWKHIQIQDTIEGFSSRRQDGPLLG